MNPRQLRQQCQAHVTQLQRELGRVFDFEALLDLAARRRGRPLHLISRSLPLGPCGMWIVTRECDYVFFEHSTSPLHHRQIILHELAHVLCNHGGSGPNLTVFAALLPHLRGAAIQRVLGRSSYSDHEEQEAEVLATLLLQHVAALPALDAWRPDLAAPNLLNWHAAAAE